VKVAAGFFCLIMLLTGIVHAAADVFDRSAEVEKYLPVFQSGTRGAVIEASREIYNAGISDARLAAAINDRVLSDFKAVHRDDKIGQQYVQWAVKALAANGIEENATTLRRIGKEGAGRNIGGLCKQEREKIPWYKTRNELMASTKNHRDGDDPQASRILNLLLADDFSYKLYAADLMNWQRKLDPRLFEAIEKQVLQNMDVTVAGTPHDRAKTIGLYIKLLGYSGNVRYRDTLHKVLASKASFQTKKHAGEALERLRQ